LLGGKGQAKHDHLYWEYRGQTAVRQDDWKAFKNRRGGWELYDLATDPEERHDVADANPEVVQRMVALAKAAHEPVRPGEVHDRALTNKDHRMAPHKGNLKFLRGTAGR